MKASKLNMHRTAFQQVFYVTPKSTQQDKKETSASLLFRSRKGGKQLALDKRAWEVTATAKDVMDHSCLVNTHQSNSPHMMLPLLIIIRFFNQ